MLGCSRASSASERHLQRESNEAAELRSVASLKLKREQHRMERRHWDRLNISVPLFVRGANPNGETFLEFATALNLSAGGVLVASRRDLDCDSAVSLEMPPSISQPQLPRAATRFHAKVLRSLPTRHYFLLGLQFDRPLVPDPEPSAPESQ